MRTLAILFILVITFDRAFCQSIIDDFKIQLTGGKEKTWLKEKKMVKEERLGASCKSDQSYTFRHSSDTVVYKTCTRGKWNEGIYLTYRIEVRDGNRCMLIFNDGNSYYVKFLKKGKRRYLRLSKTHPKITELDKDIYLYE